MSPEFVTLESSELLVRVDAGRGADILSIVQKTQDVDVMFATPWRVRADAIREGRSTGVTTGSMQSWLEGYRGGWQTLCPNAGPPREVHGAMVGFHGEACLVSWSIEARSPQSVKLETSLFLVPITITREIVVEGDVVSISDVITNLSDEELTFDFSYHPALGGAFLDGPCTVTTGARHFVNDVDGGIDGVEPGSRHDWPFVRRRDGTCMDLQEVPAGGPARSVFGWLTDFDEHCAQVRNHLSGMTVELAWDGRHLPYAWLWQELNSTAGWPWFRRARVIAIEPSSSPTGGPDRRSAIALAPHADIRISMNLSIRIGGTEHG